MNKENIRHLPINPATKQEGERRIRAYRTALKHAEEDGSLASYEATDPMLDAVASHPLAVKMLKEWGIVVKRHSPDGQPVFLNKTGRYARSWEIPIETEEQI